MWDGYSHSDEFFFRDEIARHRFNLPYACSFPIVAKPPVRVSFLQYSGHTVTTAISVCTVHPFQYQGLGQARQGLSHAFDIPHPPGNRAVLSIQQRSHLPQETAVGDCEKRSGDSLTGEPSGFMMLTKSLI